MSVQELSPPDAPQHHYRNPSRLRRLGGLLLRGGGNWPVVLAIAALGLMVVVPLAFLTTSSFRTGTPGNMGPWTFDNYQRALGSQQLWPALRNSVLVAVISTAVSLTVATAFAWLVERTNLPFRNLAWAVMLLPIAVPNILFVLSWTILLRDRSGLINVFLRDTFPVLFSGESGPFGIYSLGGVIFLDSMRGTTTVFLMLVAAFRMFDPALEEASRASGATTLQTLRRVTLPALLPALSAAGIYSFISSMDQFEAALAVGLPGGVFLLPTLIYFAVSLRAPIDYGLGAVYSVGFMLIMVGLVIMYRFIAKNTERFATITGKGYRPQRIKLGKWRWPALGFVALFGFMTIILPMWTMAWLSLRPQFTTIALGTGIPSTFNNYQSLLATGHLGRITWNTMSMTILTATLTMILCFLVSWVIVRGRRRVAGFVDGLTFLPYAFPGITIAIAMIFVFLNEPFRSLGLYGSVWVLVIALTTQYIAFGTRLMNGAVIQVKGELEDAGRASGASSFAAMRRITMPLLLPAFIAGWVWVAANAMRTFSIPLILATGRNNQVFSSQIWNLWEVGHYGTAAAYGTILILILLPVTVLLRRLLAYANKDD